MKLLLSATKQLTAKIFAFPLTRLTETFLLLQFTAPFSHSSAPAAGYSLCCRVHEQLAAPNPPQALVLTGSSMWPGAHVLCMIQYVSELFQGSSDFRLGGLCMPAVYLFYDLEGI